MYIDQPGRPLMWAAIERGLRYTDIAPHLTELGRGAAYEKVDAAARASGARIVLGTGTVPGISNVMARALADSLGGVDEIQTALLLSANDVTGPASVDYFLRELSMSFDIWVEGRDHATPAFSQPQVVDFPPPVGTKRGYLFPFSDQVLYPRTLGVRTAITRLAIEPGWVTTLLAWLVRTGISPLLANKAVRRAVAWQRRNRLSNADARFALCVEVECGDRSKRATLLGRGQANATAIGAAGIARLLIESDSAGPGAWMPEQIVEPRAFFSLLASRGF